jgi:hypothetical protein
VISSTKQISPKVIKKLKGNSGPRGLAGPQGAQGAVGTVDTANFFNRTESDGRYLGKGEQAADSAKLGGVAASGYTSGEGTQGGNWIEMLDKQKEPNFLSVPGIGELALECATGTPATNVTLTQHAGSPVFLTWGSYPKGQPTRTKTAVLKEDGNTEIETFAPGESGTGQMIIQATGDLSTSVHTFATITVSPRSPEASAASRPTTRSRSGASEIGHRGPSLAFRRARGRAGVAVLSVKVRRA